MHIVELAFRMRQRNRAAAAMIQRAWLSCRKPLRQAVVFGPPKYSLTRMVHALGGFYQTHASDFTTHVLCDAASAPRPRPSARVRGTGGCTGCTRRTRRQSSEAWGDRGVQLAAAQPRSSPMRRCRA